MFRYNNIAIALTLSAMGAPAFAAHTDLPDMSVVGQRSGFFSYVLQPDLVNAPQGDIAALLKNIPGANVNANGTLTGIAQYRGMYGDRVNMLIDGIKISSGGPNAMDPSLSYIPRAQLQSLEVIRGIAPVSSGNETIGGTILARSEPGKFGQTENFEFHGSASVGGQTADSSYDISGLFSLSNLNHKIYAAASREEGDDIDFDGGTIHPTEHERNNYKLGYGYSRGDHKFGVDYVLRDSGAAGTPALPMDIVYVDADIAKANYSGQFDNVKVNSKVYWSQVDHKMSNFELRDPPIMTMMMGGMMMSMPMRRFALTDSEDYGYDLDLSFPAAGGTLKIGTEGHLAEHNADVFNPMDSNFIINNYEDIQRDVFGIYGEWDRTISSAWDMQFGLRYTRVNMDAGTVSAIGFPMAMLQMQANMLANAFNASERDQEDNNIDWAIKLTHHYSDVLDFEIGVARKTRAPSYQERYLWLPLQSTGGLADGNNYVGNVNLDSETSHQFELGLDWHNEKVYFAPRAFYHHVDDYIQGDDYTAGGAAQMFHNMITTMLGSNAKLLQFSNVDARLYGVDVDWAYLINPNWTLNGIFSFVQGERRDNGDNLYRIAPLTATVALTHQRENWSATLETVGVSDKRSVSEVTNERETAGYMLLNLYGQYNVPGSGFRLTAGVDNLLDKFYASHLGGINRVSNSDVARGQRIPGAGISGYLNLNLEW